ncbi:MAG: ROK family transcriptional regulator [Gemmobacter sp.]
MTVPETALPQPASLRGSNQSGMRAWNERVVLSLVRGQGALSKADIARTTGLSAQTVSVIMRALEQDGLLARGEPVRGRVGQPSVPMSLAADGAFFLGLKIGRRSSDMLLTDFQGRVRARRTRRHAWPEPDAAVGFARDAAAELVATLPAALQPRLAGMGIAMPFQLWGWAEAIGAPQAAMEAWRGRDIRAEIARDAPWPVLLQNDATAACGAELVFGTAPLPRDFVYFYIAFFIGGGVVLNGSLLAGPGGNAGALGSMPVRAADGGMVQLIDLASIAVLERALVARGLSPDLLWTSAEAWHLPPDLLDAWVAGAAQAIAQAIVASLSVIDFPAAVIDGWMPPALRARMAAAVRSALSGMNLSGLDMPEVLAGTLGPEARPLGAAALPLTSRFLVDQGAFLSPIEP